MSKKSKKSVAKKDVVGVESEVIVVKENKAVEKEKRAMIDIAPGIQATFSKKSYYITTEGGVRKFASAERFEKLKQRAGGDLFKLVESYRVRKPKAVEVTSPEVEVVEA